MIYELYVRYIIMFNVFYFKEGIFSKMILFFSYVCFYCSIVFFIIFGNCYFLIYWYVFVLGSLYLVIKLINYNIIYNYMYLVLLLLLFFFWFCFCRSSLGFVGRFFFFFFIRVGLGSRVFFFWFRFFIVVVGRIIWGLV